jgi:hypothetical protein
MLGIMVDTQRELYLLLPDKIKKLSDASKRYRQNCIRRKRRSPLRDLQRFCGLANSTSLAVSDSRLYLRALFNCAADQKTGQKVVLCHQSLRNLKWWANIAENQHIGRTIWEPTPKALLVTDASMEGWGAIWHEPTNQSKGCNIPPQCPGSETNISVPARGLFKPSDAQPRSINQRKILAAILGIRTFLRQAKKSHVQQVSDSQVTLAVIKNWTSKSCTIMRLLRILRGLYKNHGLSLGLQYIPSVVPWIFNPFLVLLCCFPTPRARHLGR